MAGTQVAPLYEENGRKQTRGGKWKRRDAEKVEARWRKNGAEGGDESRGRGGDCKRKKGPGRIERKTVMMMSRTKRRVSDSFDNLPQDY